MQIRIFEARPFLNLYPNENSSFHRGICISFNDSGTLQVLSYYQLLFMMLTASPDGTLEMFARDSLTKFNLSFANSLV